ncbi:MAG TPA: diaminopimelate epimerase [Methanoregulaceae archaeon]|nr:diaminopimelate epimerase [Methanoregulaceae archaeon]
MDLPFVKLHGNGNDFVLIDEHEKVRIPDGMKAEFARLYCDRRFGIGADGVLFLSVDGAGGLVMRLFQPDGSEAEMCGNGVRCFAKYVRDAGLAEDSFVVQTGAGPVPVETRYGEDGEFEATIGMPDPLFDRPSIPATGEGDYREVIGGQTVHAANTGVPHAVVFVGDVDAVDVDGLAPPIRWHPSFPNGANVNFVQVTGTDALRIRTFERGVEAETLSCGTGATAAAAVANRLGLVGTEVGVETTGGPLRIVLGHETTMTGPAETVFTGVLEL